MGSAKVDLRPFDKPYGIEYDTPTNSKAPPAGVASTGARRLTTQTAKPVWLAACIVLHFADETKSGSLLTHGAAAFRLAQDEG